ncbi:MAG TPA: hypothetical protein VGI46_01715 [Candidatus Acidoferrum sp.]|jgi:hypothetical protein
MERLESFRKFTSTAPSMGSRAATAAETLFGAATVGLFAVSGGVVSWIVNSQGWVLFFLVTKPLIDLTWRVRFFEFSEQGVNIQTFVSLLVLGMNGVAMLSSNRWRILPRRVLVFLGCAAFSVMVTPSSWAFNELLRLFAGVTFFYTAGPLLAEAERFDRFARALLVVAAVPVFLSFLQRAGLLEYDYWDWIEGVQIGRASGAYETPLSLIFLLIYVFPLAMYLASGKNHSPVTKGMARIFLLAASVSTAFTYHRVGYIAISLEGLFWLYLKRGKGAVLVLAGVLVLIAAISSSWLVSLYDPLRQALHGNDEITSDQFLRGRGYQWFLYLNSYVSSGPFHWVFGNGGSVIADLDPDINYVLSPNEPHSDYIRILHAYGIAGFSIYLSVLGHFCAAAIRRLRSPDPFTRALGQMMLPMLAAFALLSFTTEPLRYPGASWYLFAIGSALFCLKKPLASAVNPPGRSALAETTS